MAYNLTNLSGANNFGEMLTAVNSLSGNVLGLSLLIVVWVFIFINVVDTNRIKVATASFITTILAGGFLVVGLINNSVMWIVGFILALSLVLLYVNSRE